MIQEKAVTNTVEMLKNIGADFEIRFNGKVWGGFKRKRASPKLDYSSYMLKERLSKLKVGEVEKIEFNNLIEGITPDRLQSRVCSEMCHIFGKGTYITELEGNNIQVMRTQ